MISIVLVALALGLTLWLAIKFPRHATLLLALILPSYLIRLSLLTIPTTYLELSVWVVALGLLFNPSARKNLVTFITHLPRPFIYATAGFLLAAVISTIISPNLYSSAGILKGWVITPIMAGAVIGSAIRSKKDIQSLIFALIASGAAMAAYALVAFHPSSRLVGIYDVPNSLALFTSPLLTASIWQLWTTEEKNKKYLLMAASIIMGIALVGTQSLGGIVSVIVALLITSAIYSTGHQKKRHLLTLFILTVIAGAVLWQTGKLQYLLTPLINPDKTNSISVRLQLWSISWELIREHPLLGIGLGQFEPNYQRKLHERFQSHVPASGGQPLPEFVFRDPHNWLLSFYLNTGLLGVLSFIMLNFYVLKNVVRGTDPLRITYPLVGALLTILMFGLTDTIYWKNDLAPIYWVMIFSIFSVVE